jgi:arylsulfatase A-like enzyme
MPEIRPNILLILIDDLGWRDLVCCGSDFYDTPNLDRLATEGIRFTDAYSACPVCSPSRASLLTGRYPARLGLTNFIGGHTRGRLIDAPYIDHLPLEEFNLARALKQGGYATWHVGKWHLGSQDYYPEQQGFDVNIGGCHWGGPRTYFSPYGNNPRLEDGPTGEYLTDRLTSDAVNLIRTHNPQKDGPFFLNLWHYAVHIPIQSPIDLVENYTQKARDLGLDKLQPLEEGEFFPCEHKHDQHVVRRRFQSDPAYAAMIFNLDWNVGRLLDVLEETGQVENTIVIFSSDNGGLATAEGSPTCNLPLAEGKGWMYEGGTRVPLLMRWPKVIQPGCICGAPVTSPDFYPTLLEAAGLEAIPTQHCDGVSFLPLLLGAQGMPERPIFWHYPHYGNQGGTPGASVRLGDYKLIEFFEDERLELYNLRQDPGENTSLTEVEPQCCAALHTLLRDWQREVSARIPAVNPEYGL